MRARGRRGGGGAERGVGGGCGGGVVIFVARTVRGGVCGRGKSTRGGLCAAGTTPQLAGGGPRGAGSGRFLAAGARREAGLCPCRPGDQGRLVPVPREAPRRRVPASAAFLHGPGSEGTRLQGEARPGSCEARQVEDARLLLSREGSSGSRRPVLKAGTSGVVPCGGMAEDL